MERITHSLSLDTTYRDRDNDGYDDRDDDCDTTYGTSYRGSYQGCTDSDGDGWANMEDEFPYDSGEWSDYDGDGYGDNEDEFPYDAGEWSDYDGDGYGDNEDEFHTTPANGAITMVMATEITGIIPLRPQ